MLAVGLTTKSYRDQSCRALGSYGVSYADYAAVKQLTLYQAASSHSITHMPQAARNSIDLKTIKRFVSRRSGGFSRVEHRRVQVRGEDPFPRRRVNSGQLVNKDVTSTGDMVCIGREGQVDETECEFSCDDR